MQHTLSTVIHFNSLYAVAFVPTFFRDRYSVKKASWKNLLESVFETYRTLTLEAERLWALSCKVSKSLKTYFFDDERIIIYLIRTASVYK